MRLIIRNDKAETSRYVAEYIKSRINKFAPTADRPFVLGLPTGSSPEIVYSHLVRYVKAGELSFKHVITFNMVHLPWADSANSARTNMWGSRVTTQKVTTASCGSICFLTSTSTPQT